MRPQLVLLPDKGWYCGRLMLWPAMVLGAGLSTFVVFPLQMAIQFFTHTRQPWGLIVTVYLGSRVVERLMRKRDGEPFRYDPLLYNDIRTRIRDVRRADEPGFFWFLFCFECLMFGSALALQAAILLTAANRAR